MGFMDSIPLAYRFWYQQSTAPAVGFLSFQLIIWSPLCSMFFGIFCLHENHNNQTLHVGKYTVRPMEHLANHGFMDRRTARPNGTKGSKTGILGKAVAFGISPMFNTRVLP